MASGTTRIRSRSSTIPERRRAPAGGPLVFQIGFHRCGTTALAAFFERCGLPCVHYDRGRLARRLRENLAAGRPPLAGYEGYRAFANMQYEDGADYFDGMAQFRALDAAYDARFVLNTRPLEHWLRSLAVHYARRPRALGPPCLEARFGTTDPGAVAAGCLISSLAPEPCLRPKGGQSSPVVQGRVLEGPRSATTRHSTYSARWMLYMLGRSYRPRSVSRTWSSRELLMVCHKRASVRRLFSAGSAPGDAGPAAICLAAPGATLDGHGAKVSAPSVTRASCN